MKALLLAAMEAPPITSTKPSVTVKQQPNMATSGLTPAAASLLSSDIRIEGVGVAAPVLLDTSLSGQP